MNSAAFEELAESFAFLDDWEDRYRHVIDMGKAMRPLDHAFQTDRFKVEGCASQVWIRPLFTGQGPEAIFDFQGASDAMIVHGLVAILHTLYSGQTAEQVVNIDAPAALARLGLDAHLSAQRSNGVRAMIARIRATGQAYLSKA